MKKRFNVKEMRMFKKRTIGLLLLLLLPLTAFSGGTEEVEEAKPVVLRIHVDENLQLRHAVAMFQVAHPNVTIEFIPAGEEEGLKTLAMIRANDLPDAFRVETGGATTRNLPIYIENDLLDPVPAWVKKDVGWENNCIEFCKEYYKDADTGEILALPVTYDLKPFFFYRVDALKEVGLDPMNIPQEMNAWWEANKKLVKRDSTGEVTRYAMRTFAFVIDYGLNFILADVEPKGDPSDLYSYMGGSGKDDPYRLTAPEFVKSMERYQRMCYGPDLIFDNAYADRMEGLKSDFYAGVTAGTWFEQSLEPAGMEYVVLPPPNAKGKKPKASATTNAYGVVNTSKNKELAWEFLEILATDVDWWTWAWTPREVAGQTVFDRNLPSYHSVWDGLGKAGFDIDKYAYALKDFQPVIEPKSDPKYNQVLLEVIQPAFTAINVEGEDVVEQLTSAEQKANKILRSSD